MISDYVKDYRELIPGEVKIPTKYEEDNIKHEIIRKNNLLDMKNLLISLHDKFSFIIVSNSKKFYEDF